MSLGRVTVRVKNVKLDPVSDVLFHDHLGSIFQYHNIDPNSTMCVGGAVASWLVRSFLD